MRSKDLFLAVTLACVFYGLIVEGSTGGNTRGVTKIQCEPPFKLPFDDHELSSFLSDDKDAVPQDETRVLGDENFKYVMGGRDERKVVCLNTDATLYDLCNFADAVCWHHYLKGKISYKTAMTVEDTELLRFCIAADLDMMDTIASAVLNDMFGGVLGASFLRNGECNSRGKRLYEGLRSRFIYGNEEYRNVIRDWADIFHDSKFTPTCEVLGGVIAATRNAYAGDGRKPSNIENHSMRITMPGKEIGHKWWKVRESVRRYQVMSAEIRKTIMRMRTAGITDSRTLSFLDEIEDKMRNRDHIFDYVLYDLPFCILTYRALGNLRKCKGPWYVSDDKKKMKEEAADYTYAIYGTEMLRRIRTRYAASCYTTVIKFLKSDLEKEFKNFVNETKLYKITLNEDEGGEQDNKLDAL